MKIQVSLFSKLRALFKKAANPANLGAKNAIYELLFCDNVALYRDGFSGERAYPWDILFDVAPSERDLLRITKDPAVESRQKLLAFWLFPNRDLAKLELLGLVVEVGLEGGLDVLAAYRDASARYLNHGGAMIIWEGEDVGIAEKIKTLLAEGESAIKKMGPWDRKRLPPPTTGNLRVTFLTSNGIYFGEGPIDVISSDGVGGPVVRKGVELMEKLMEKSTKGS